MAMMQAKRCSATKVRLLNVSLPVSEDSEASTWKMLVPAESSMLWSEVGPLYDGTTKSQYRPSEGKERQPATRHFHLRTETTEESRCINTVYSEPLKHFHRTFCLGPGPGLGR
jgi:hypothetical protein